MNSRLLRRATAAIAGLLAASVVLSGCLYLTISEEKTTPGPVTPAPTVSQTPDSSGVAPELRRFYEQKLDWQDCNGGFDCTDVTAPLDWENPDAGEITIAVVRHRARGTALGSLLMNPGGPGGSGYSFVRDSMAYAVGAELIDNYDIIGFDPRGVGLSSAVSCLSGDEMDDYLYDIPSAPRGSAEWEAELTAANQRFADACERNSGGILPYITTVNSAHDMDLLRGVLGDEKLNYLGYSYGTFLGATYANLHPDRVGRLVLDGAIDPSIPGLDVGTTQAVGFEAALRAYMADCLAGGMCPFSGTVDDAMIDLAALLASVDARPLQNSDGRIMGADSLMLGIIAALYAEANWVYLTMALDGALTGDPSMAFVLADLYNGRVRDGLYEDNSTEAFRAYNCVDYPEDDDPAAEEAANAKVRELAPTIAPYWDGPSTCAVWPHPPTGTRGPIHAPGTAPILVIGTTNDPATPYEWSVALAEQLESGVLITRVGEGHTGYNKGNVCVDRAVESFFVGDVVPEDGLRCE